MIPQAEHSNVFPRYLLNDFDQAMRDPSLRHLYPYSSRITGLLTRAPISTEIDPGEVARFADKFRIPSK